MTCYLFTFDYAIASNGLFLREVDPVLASYMGQCVNNLQGPVPPIRFLKDGRKIRIITPRLLLTNVKEGSASPDFKVYRRWDGGLVGSLSGADERVSSSLWYYVTVSIYHQDQGFGFEAKFAVLKYLFDSNARLEKVVDDVDKYNIASQKLHEKLGYHNDPNNSPRMFVTRDDFRRIESELDVLHRGSSAFWPRH